MLTSILDTDFYKLTMQHAVLRMYPNLYVRYTFYDRNHTRYPKGFAQRLEEKIHAWSTLSLTREEEAFLKQAAPFLPDGYVSLLKAYHFDPREVRISQDREGRLSIRIEGLWWRTILWEVPLLALVSEEYYTQMGLEHEPIMRIEEKTRRKARMLQEHGIRFADFGTRRRYSYDLHDRIVGWLKEEAGDCFVGTSNVHLAQKYAVKPIGTQAHEWFMAHAPLFGYEYANRAALEAWQRVYEGRLGIALTDTFTLDVFLRHFTMPLAKLFDGVRHDSGSPEWFTDRIIHHYETLGIDPKSKTIIFSDSLTPERAITIHEYVNGRIQTSFGIGTNLTNDAGVKPLNIVIKLSHVKHPVLEEWIPTVKLSDDTGKHTGEPAEVKRALISLRLQDP